MIEYLLLSLGVLGVFIASVTDIKKREVPDWLSYSMIAAGLGIRTLSSITNQNLSFLLSGIIGFSLYFVIANAMYYTKQWGGGDSKLLMGIGAIYGTGITPTPSLPFLLEFLLNIFIIGAVYSIIYAIILAFQKRTEFFKEVTKSRFIKKSYFYTAIFLLIVSAGISSFFLQGINKFFGLILSGFIFILISSLFFIKPIEKVALRKNIQLPQLTEGDWILGTLKIGEKTITPSRLGISKEEIDYLKNHHYNGTITIQEGIPFVPVFFLSLISTLLFGNVLFLLF